MRNFIRITRQETPVVKEPLETFLEALNTAVMRTSSTEEGPLRLKNALFKTSELFRINGN